MAGMVNCRVDIPAERVTLYCLAFSPASPFPLNPKLSRVLLLLPPGAWLLRRSQSLDWLLDWGEYRLFEVWAGVGVAVLFPLKGKTFHLWDLPVKGRSFNLKMKPAVSFAEEDRITCSRSLPSVGSLKSMEDPRRGGPSLKRPVPPLPMEAPGGRRSPGRVPLPRPPKKSSSLNPEDGRQWI